jgi:hypothetical protein
VSDNEPAPIIHRPPSSPIGSTLLIVTTIGLLIGIGVVWTELFGEYLPTLKPGQSEDPEMKNHGSKKIALEHTRDHYGADFGQDTDILEAVERELGVNRRIGDLEAKATGGDGGGETPPEQPPPGNPEATTDAPPKDG